MVLDFWDDFCPECAATGTCTLCEGEGKIAAYLLNPQDTSDELLVCPSCSGVGYCPMCGGTGHVVG